MEAASDVREGIRLCYVIRLILICMLLAGSLVRAQRSVPDADLVVSTPVANMYKNATADSEVTSQVLYGTGVRSLEKQGDWIRIRTADDYSGWISSGDVNAKNGTSRAPEGKVVRVTALSANVYREPDVTEHAPVLRLPWESILEVAADSPKDDARWLKVRLVDGQSRGYSMGMSKRRERRFRLRRCCGWRGDSWG